jgi:hypothetical protein
MCKVGQKGPIYDGIVGKIRDMVDEALDWYAESNNVRSQLHGSLI